MYGGAVQPGLPDHHKARVAWFGAEGAVEIGVHAWANRLNGQAHGFACHCRESLEPQDVMGADHVGHLCGERLGIGDFGAGHDKGFKSVVIVVMGMIMVMIVVMIVVIVMMVMMMFVARVHVGLGPGTLP